MSDFWWGMIWLTLFIPLMYLWGFTLWDVFSRRDLKGWAKAFWAMAIVFIPLAGMLVYFIARPKDLEPYGRSYGYSYGAPYQDGMQYQRASGPAPDPRDVETLDRLHESGSLTDEEYQRLKERTTSQEPRAA